MSDAATNTDIAALSFEKAVAELESIVNRLERGDVALDDPNAAKLHGCPLRRQQVSYGRHRRI